MKERLFCVRVVVTQGTNAYPMEAIQSSRNEQCFPFPPIAGADLGAEHVHAHVFKLWFRQEGKRRTGSVSIDPWPVSSGNKVENISPDQQKKIVD